MRHAMIGATAMNAVNPAVLFAARTEEQVAEYFTSAGAVSPATAIPVPVDKLKEILEAPEFLEVPLERYTFIKRTPQGTYYLDRTVLAVQQRTLRTVLFVIFITVAFISLVSVLFGFFGFMTNS